LYLNKEEKNYVKILTALSFLYHTHIREKCPLSLKQATKYSAERDAPRTIELRLNIVSQWKAAGVDFQNNCVFIDEAEFRSQMMRGRAWSKVGVPANVKVHTQKTQKGINISIVGYILPFGIINLSKVELLKKRDTARTEKEFSQESTSKKRECQAKATQKRNDSLSYT
jgi:hypothetical protein